MFHLFLSRKRTMLGVDIRPSSIQLLLLSSEVKHRQIQYCLEYYAHIHQPHDMSLIEQEAHLKMLLLSMPFSYQRCIVALQDSLTWRKTLVFHQGVNEFYLEELIKNELAKHLLPSQTCYLDFKVLGQSLNEQEMLDVFVIAAPSDIVDKKIGLLNRTGIKIDVLDVEYNALERIIPWIVPQWLHDAQERYIAVLHLERNHLVVWILQGLRVIFSHEEAHAFGAEIAKNNQSTEASWPLLLQLVTRTFQIFFSHYEKVKIDYLILMGTQVCHGEVEAVFEHYFSVPTQIANPFSTMNKSFLIDDSKLAIDSPALTMACALALFE